MSLESRGELLMLTMIGKDEAATIARTLRAVTPFGDRWVIADTGVSSQRRPRWLHVCGPDCLS